MDAEQLVILRCVALHIAATRRSGLGGVGARGTAGASRFPKLHEYVIADAEHYLAWILDIKAESEAT